MIRVTSEVPDVGEMLALDYTQELKHIQLYNDILDYQKFITALEKERHNLGDQLQKSFDLHE